ncbi:MAG: response regulator transcription factor [Desulfuromonadales bacterium]
MNRLLIIDDDRELCELLGDYLDGEGYRVESVNEPAAGIERALSGEHDLVVLDVMMPHMNGFDVLRRIRSVSKIPVLMLTARGSDIDRIVGLEIGADDYLPKPFNSRELVARIKAVLRRMEPDVLKERKVPGCITVGDLVLNSGMRSLSRCGQQLEISSIEFSILEVLLGMAGQVLTRDELARRALGRENSVYDRSIDVHISSLRRKLGPDPGNNERIKTVRNLGYQYVLSQNTGVTSQHH